MDTNLEDIINKMTITPPLDISIDKRKQSVQKRRFIISYSVPNPTKKGLYTVGQRLLTDQEVTKRADELVREVKKKLPREIQRYDFLLKYNNILYDDATIEDIGIKNDTVVELECLTQNQHMVHNEGVLFVYWSILPLIFACSLIGAGLIGTFDIFVRTVYVVVGTAIAVPSIVYTIIGISEYSPALLRTSFVGRYWFSDSLSCCRCCCCKKNNLHGFEDYTAIESESDSVQIVVPVV